jgi:hypothetical protein
MAKLCETLTGGRLAAQRQQHRKRIKNEYQQCRNQPHYGFCIVRAEQLGEIERQTGLGAYAGAPRLDLGLLHFEISRPIGCLLPFDH